MSSVSIIQDGKLETTDSLTPGDGKIRQLKTTLLVRIRRKGHPDQNFSVSSYAQAEQLADKIESEHGRGLFVDYAKSQRVTVADLIRRYIDEECPNHKGWKIEANTLRAMLVDKDTSTKSTDRHDHPQGAGAKRPVSPRRKGGPRINLEWLDMPFAMVQPDDIERYKRGRLLQVAPGTVDRELDLISQVINIAIETWRYPVAQSPMSGVRRPKYFNERDRRLQGDECERLLIAAREEDRLRSHELAVDARLEEARGLAARSKRSESTRKRIIAAARRAAIEELRAGFPVIQTWETLILFLLESAARKAEALKLRWADVCLEDQTAYFPETKNGRPRRIPIQQESAHMVRALPRDGDRVFPVSADAFDGAWARVCARAGIVDLHIHDLRHEALSRIAEVGHAVGQHFTLIDLAAISGHRDLRMLARYSHLSASHLAHRLDAMFSQARANPGNLHKGRVRLGGDTGVTVKDAIGEPDRVPLPPPVTRSEPVPGANIVSLSDFRRRV